MNIAYEKLSLIIVLKLVFKNCHIASLKAIRAMGYLCLSRIFGLFQLLYKLQTTQRFG